MKVKLPEVRDIAQVSQAMAQLLVAVAKGLIVPGKGQALAGLWEGVHKPLELEDIERRLAAGENGKRSVR